MANLSKFAARLAKDEKTANADKIKLQEAMAKSEVEKAISNLRVQKLTLQSAKEATLSTNPFSTAKFFALVQEEATVEAQLALAEKVLAEEFGSN